MTLATDGSTKPLSTERRSDELVATASSKEEAEALRQVVIKGGTRLWVFVYPHKNGRYSITAANEWGGSLSAGVLVKLKADCDAYIVSTLEELDVNDVVEEGHQSVAWDSPGMQPPVFLDKDPAGED